MKIQGRIQESQGGGGNLSVLEVGTWKANPIWRLQNIIKILVNFPLLF